MMDERRKETGLIMKLAFMLILAGASCAYAQESGNVFYQHQSTGPVTTVAGAAMLGPVTPVQGAPYSATITNESVQMLADGNRIVQTSNGTTARDSLGRTRQDATLPVIGNMSAANAPHLVFIQDPAAQTSYTLNLTDKTAMKNPAPLPPPPGAAGQSQSVSSTFFMATGGAAAAGAPLPPPPPMALQKFLPAGEDSQASTEDLGSQTMEGLLVNGVRTTRTIPTGEIGNEKPIVIVTEVWTSPDLKTIVSSKRSDPRMGEQTFRLTNIVRAEPDASLFVVPSDFKVIDRPKTFVYRSNR
jgi:hypothetical protein